MSEAHANFVTLSSAASDSPAFRDCGSSAHASRSPRYACKSQPYRGIILSAYLCSKEFEGEHADDRGAAHPLIMQIRTSVGSGAFKCGWLRLGLRAGGNDEDLRAQLTGGNLQPGPKCHRRQQVERLLW